MEIVQGIVNFFFGFAIGWMWMDIRRLKKGGR